MHDRASLNFETAPADSLRIDALSVAALYGKGVFTTMAVYDGKPFLWEKHWRRLNANAMRVGIAFSDFTESKTMEALDVLLRENRVKNGRVRVTIFDGSASELWPGGSSAGTSLLITTADFGPRPGRLKLGTSEYAIDSRSPLIGVKSCNYLDKIISLAEARRRGFDECVQLNERGEAASASMANIFWIKDAKLFTPSLETGCLPGTTREYVMENMECEEVNVGIDALESADAVFVASAGRGVQQVSELSGRPLSSEQYLITRLLPRI